MNRCIFGDCRDGMRELIAQGVKVQCVVTSPPYFGLRDYGTAQWEGGEEGCDHVGSIARTAPAGTAKQASNAGSVSVFSGDCAKCGARRIDKQLGLESTPEEYVANMVEVFRLVRELLVDDGTLWLNIGDSYAGSWGNQGRKEDRGTQRPINGGMMQSVRDGRYPDTGSGTGSLSRTPGLKPKDLIGIPWRLAFALQADGWYLRQEIIWHKPSPMPESVTDRCTKAHESIFLLAKSERYFFDAQAIAERSAMGPRVCPPSLGNVTGRGIDGINDRRTRPANHIDVGATRNRRSVWTIASEAYSGSHFAVMPTALVEPCILAGTSQKGHCRVCGKGWVRVVERIGGPPCGDHRKNHEVDNCKTAHASGTVAGSGLSRIYAEYGYAENRTRGWQPSCSCGVEPVPGIVFDPFLGSGTVGQVAQALGRNWLGCELNEQYRPLQERRTAQQGLMLG